MLVSAEEPAESQCELWNMGSLEAAEDVLHGNRGSPVAHLQLVKSGQNRFGCEVELAAKKVVYPQRVNVPWGERVGGKVSFVESHDGLGARLDRRCQYVTVFGVVSQDGNEVLVRFDLGEGEGMVHRLNARADAVCRNATVSQVALDFSEDLYGPAHVVHAGFGDTEHEVTEGRWDEDASVQDDGEHECSASDRGVAVKVVQARFLAHFLHPMERSGAFAPKSVLVCDQVIEAYAPVCSTHLKG